MSREYISKVLKEKRKESKLSVKDVIKILSDKGIELSQNALYNYETGFRQPDADTLLVLCEIYGIDDVLEVFGYGNQENNANEMALSIEEKELITLFRELHPASKKTVLDLIKLQSKPIEQDQEAEKEMKKHIEHVNAFVAEYAEMNVPKLKAK
jgi:transcriptional regulator with XRE-family HTH domain